MGKILFSIATLTVLLFAKSVVSADHPQCRAEAAAVTEARAVARAARASAERTWAFARTGIKKLLAKISQLEGDLTTCRGDLEECEKSIPADCYAGNIEVKTSTDLQLLQSQTCVNGSVIISGILTSGGEIFETLDFGNLKEIRGILYVTLNPRLKFLTAENLESVWYVAIWNNPMLSKCKVLDLARQTGCEYRYDASLDAQEECE
jgi:hypothetical protein